MSDAGRIEALGGPRRTADRLADALRRIAKLERQGGRLPRYATADRPVAADFPGLRIWNTTLGVEQTSNGVDWGDWHFVGSGGEPAFANGWTNYGGSWQALRFRRTARGTVEVQGAIKSGTTGWPVGGVFTLPSGFRPAAANQYAVTSAHVSGMGTVEIPNNGIVYVPVGSTTITYIALEFSTL